MPLIYLRLAVLVFACILPLWLAIALQIYHSYSAKKMQVMERTLDTARALALTMDRELASIQAALGALATSPAFTSGDFATLHRQTLALLVSYPGCDIIVADDTGQQVVNSYQPFGSPLPRRNASSSVLSIFADAKPSVTDLFFGAVTERALVGVDVPVLHDGRVRYDLAMTLPADRLAAVLGEQRLPADWIGAIIDSKGILVARTRRAEDFVGHPASAHLRAAAAGATEGVFDDVTLDGTEVISAFSRSRLSGWSAAVGAPRSSLFAEIRQWLWWSLGGVGFSSLASIGIATLIGRQIARANQDLERYKEEIKTLAFFDTLTGLPNRRLLQDRLHQATIACDRSGRRGALLFVDLDNFKTLNDTRGHAVGDLLLVEVARRLQSCVRESDTVARLGGDEFVIVLENLSPDDDEAIHLAEVVGQKILEVLTEPYFLAGYQHHSSPSIGATVFHGRTESTEDLLKQADLAMYQAKFAGRNTLRFFEPAMQASLAARSVLEVDLHRAIAQNELVLHYQPQVDRNGRVIGAEGLVRWQHPRDGLIPPGGFIPLAEETGIILAIGNQVLEMACRQLVAWEKDGATAHLSLAVNVSARQFRHHLFVDRVRTVLQQSGANAAKLKLEVTESLLLHDLDDVAAKMEALRAIGVRFSLDDFGTGYSSLAYLKQLPLDQVKIDRSFVRDVTTDPNDAVIARTIILLGKSLGLRVIAEGVESQDQWDFLAAEGCDEAQGYLYSPPIPIERFDDVVAGTAPDAQREAFNARLN